MRKRILSSLVMVGVIFSTTVVVQAAKGQVVGGESGNGTKYSGYVEGGKNLSACWGATTTERKSGSENVYAYVEIVNSQGYKIGNGESRTGTTKAYSTTITRSGGKNAYGSVGTESGSSRSFAYLY